MKHVFAFVMDPIDRINLATDSSFALMVAARAHGHRVVHVAPSDVGLEDDRVFLRGRELEPLPTAVPHWRWLEAVRLHATDCKAIFIRPDPPFDAAYLTLTWILSFAENHGVRIVNSPRGIRNANEKLYALEFPELCPPTVITSSVDEVRAFMAHHDNEAILKPLDAFGGLGIMLAKDGDPNVNSMVETLTGGGKRPIVCQQYLRAGAQGDKRLFVVDGELRGGFRRIPKGPEVRNNMRAGGSAELCEITESDRRLVATLSERLRRDGIFITGLDVIGDRLLEVNVTSPTGMPVYKRLGGPDLIEEMIRNVEA